MLKRGGRTACIFRSYLSELTSINVSTRAISNISSTWEPGLRLSVGQEQLREVERVENATIQSREESA